MGKSFYYIVITTRGESHFIGQGGQYTDNFDAVLSFDSQAAAQDYAASLASGMTKVLFCRECEM